MARIFSKKQKENILPKKELVVRTYEFRLYPSKKQKEKLNFQLQICKEVYNTCLGEFKSQGFSSKIEMQEILNMIKATNPKLYYQVHSQVLQDVSHRVSGAIKNFFDRCKKKSVGNKIKVGFPRFKSKYRSMTFTQYKNELIKGKLKVSKIGNVSISMHREVKGTIKTMTIKVKPSGKWFTHITSENEIIRKEHISKVSRSFDPGIENLLTDDLGNKIANPRFIEKSAKKLAKFQKQLSRKKFCSKNWGKAKQKVARIHEHIANQRKDSLHKLSHNLISNYSIINIEETNISRLVYHNPLAKNILDAGWGKFLFMLNYKAVTSGVLLNKVSAYNKNSRICSSCGHDNGHQELDVKSFVCNKCGFSANRDHNAALNIKHISDRTAGLAGTQSLIEI